MSTLLIVVLVVFVLGGAGAGMGYYRAPGGPYWGGGLFGLVVVLLVVWLLFGYR